MDAIQRRTRAPTVDVRGRARNAAARTAFFVAAVVVLCVVAGEARGMAGGGGGALYGGYRYNGRAVCAASAVMTLDSATVYAGKWSHAAIWSGASSVGVNAWVQAGITQVHGHAPFAYVEWMTLGGSYRILSLGPARSSLRVSLAQTPGGLWTLTAGSRRVSMRLVPTAQFNHDRDRAWTRCFVGAESEDWSKDNTMHGSVAIDGAAVFGVKL